MGKDNIFRYDAFISYRHSELDKKIAQKLHRMLETYKVPKSIMKSSGKKRIDRVFRDREELPTSSNLADNISQALKESEFLIVICSPRTPKSKWVLKEIDNFKAMHGHNRVLSLLIEGEPNESFPEQLCTIKKVDLDGDGTLEEIRVEPLAADIRASSEKQMLKKLKTEILRLLAPMLNCRYDDLYQRHKERRVKAILTASISLSAFFLSFGAFSTYQALVINQKSIEISQKNDEIVAQNETILSEIEKTQISQSRYLSDISSKLLEEGDRYRAILVAQAALPNNLADPERPYVPEAEYALSQALGVYEIDTYYDMDIVLEHGKPVKSIKSSPDGKTLMACSTDGNIYTWSVEDGSCLGKYISDSTPSSGDNVLFADENTIILSNYGHITCMDKNFNIKWQIGESASALALSDDKSLLANYYLHKINILDVATGKQLLDIDLNKLIEFEDIYTYLTCIRFNDDGNLLGVGTNNGRLLVFDVSTGDLKKEYNTGFKHVSSLAFSQEGHIAVASNRIETDNFLGKGKGMLDLFSLSSGQKVNSTDFPMSSINSLEFYPYDSNLAVVIESEKLNIIDITTGEILYSFICGDQITDYQMFDGFILTSSNDGTIRFWFLMDSGFENEWNRITRPNSINSMELCKGKIAITYKNSKNVYLMQVLQNDTTKTLSNHTYTVENVVLSQAGSHFLSYSYNGELILWNTSTEEAVKSVTFEDVIMDSRFTAGGNIIAVFRSGNVLLMDLELRIVKEKHFDFISSVFFNSDCTLAAFTGIGDEIVVLDTDDPAVAKTFNFNYTEFCSFSSNGLILAVNSFRGAGIIDLNTQNQIQLFEGEGVVTGAISDDGNVCALAFSDKTIKLYDTQTPSKEILAKDSDIHKAVSLFFNPDASLLFAGYDDSSIAIYDCRDGSLLLTVADYFQNPLEKIMFSDDGKRFACIDQSNNSLIFDALNLNILARMKAHVIDKDFRTLITTWNKEVLILPVYTTQMLLDEASKQLNGRTLTESEKKDMFIE